MNHIIMAFYRALFLPKQKLLVDFCLKGGKMGQSVWKCYWEN